jgi:hypothetical protein
MGFIDAYRSYASLTTEQKAFLREKKVDASYPLDAWIAFLSGVARYDKQGDALRKGLGWTAALGIVIGFFGFIFTESTLMLLFVMIGALALAFFFILRRIDAPDTLSRFILPLVTLLREDIDADEALHLTMDLRGGTREDKRRDSTDFEDRGRSIRQTFYNDPWIAGEGKLADGSTLGWEIVDDIRERRVTKRNPRGKIKTKYKYKIRRTFDVRVGMRGDDYAVNKIVPATGADISVKQGEKRNVLRARHMVTETALGAVPDVNDLISPIASVYQRVSINQKKG